MIRLNDILAVVVLFDQNGSQNVKNKLPKEIDLVIYDNSPIGINLNSSKKIEYIHDHRNLGICEAYNFAYKKAIEKEKNFLLLLDQDSKLTKNYFTEIHVQTLFKNLSIILPVVRDVKSNKIISPFRLNHFGFTKKNLLKGITKKRISGINSGALLSIEFLKEIKGFNPEFKLDYLDHWILRESFRLKKDILILNYVMDHSLSISKLDSSYPIERYLSILRSEKKFYSDENLFYQFGYKLRLVVRIIKLRIKGCQNLSKIAREML